MRNGFTDLLYNRPFRACRRPVIENFSPLRIVDSVIFCDNEKKMLDVIIREIRDVLESTTDEVSRVLIPCVTRALASAVYTSLINSIHSVTLL